VGSGFTRESSAGMWTIAGVAAATTESRRGDWEALLRSEWRGIVVVDSVAALSSEAELEGEMGDPQMGLQAAADAQALPQADRHRCEVADLPHLYQPESRKARRIRECRNYQGGGGGGGGRLSFTASMRVDIRRISGDQGRRQSRGFATPARKW